LILSKQVLEWQVQARAKKLLEQSEERFGVVPEALSSAIRNTMDEAQLRRLGKLAIRVTSLEQFQQDSGLGG
jgi:hypothetical protein